MGAAIPSQETRPHTSPYSVLSFTPGLQHQDTELTCQVALPRKNLQRTVRLSMACEYVMLWAVCSPGVGGRGSPNSMLERVHGGTGDVTRLVQCLPSMHKRAQGPVSHPQHHINER